MKTTIATVLLGLLAAGPGLPAAGANQPHIVVLMSDDHSWCDVGYRGHPDVKTPNLDRLAAQGMRLDQAYTTTSVCAPTRFQLHSGHYPAFGKLYDNGPQVVRTLDFPTTASALRDNGYRCVQVGKYHLEPLRNYPFEFLIPEKEVYGKDYGARAAEFIRAEMAEETTPVYLLVPFTEPHLDWHRADRQTYDPAKLTVPPYLPDTPATREALASYYTRISDLDRKIGVILDALDATGLAANTFVLWTSEQGMQVPRAKWTACDLGLRCSTVVRWPGHIKPGSRSDAFVQYVDVLPTLVAAAGGEAPAGIDGRSFLPVLLGQTDQHREYVFGASGYAPLGANFYSVRDANYKYIWNSNPGKPFGYGMTDAGKHTQAHLFDAPFRAAATAGDPRAQWLVGWVDDPPREELYHVAQDPYELDNLIGREELADIKSRLREVLRGWLTAQKDGALVRFNQEFPKP